MEELNINKIFGREDSAANIKKILQNTQIKIQNIY